MNNLTKRIIPCLDVKDGKTVKGVNFENLKTVGDPVELAKKYSISGADELVFLDITATNEKRKTIVELVEKVAREVFIPFTVGGGITDIDDIKAILAAGADKISFNSAGVKNPEIISTTANYFGSQCIVVALDAKRVDGDFYVHINAGKGRQIWILTYPRCKTEQPGKTLNTWKITGTNNQKINLQTPRRPQGTG